jgi:phage terminase Nu1 subunit (DNA packaging protein)
MRSADLTSESGSLFEDAGESVSSPGAGSLLTRRQLAKVLGCHPQTLLGWEREGLPVARHGRRGVSSLFLERDARAWLEDREKRLEAPQTDKFNIMNERARRERAQAQLAEQAHAIRARNLLPREEVERTWIAEITAVRAKLLAWPTTLADLLHRAGTLEGVVGVERSLDEAVRQLLTELATPAVVQRPKHPRKPRKVKKEKEARRA